MKILRTILLLLVALSLNAQQVLQKVNGGTANTYGNADSTQSTTVSGLGGAAHAGRVRMVTDGASGSDCTVGSGTSIVFCKDTGSAWVSLFSSGVGTVTSFSAGSLSPIFTTSVATATTTPALSFTLSAAAAHAVLGNNTGSSAAPRYFVPACGSLSDAGTGCTTTVGTAATHAATDFSGVGSPTACTNQFVTAFTLNGNAAPTSTCSTVSYGQVSGTPTLYYQTIQQGGSAQTQRPTLNFINGSGATVSCVDNSGSTRTDCTIAATGSGGSVTSFSAGTLSPIFTTSVATPTSTPALSFSLSNFAAHAILGNNTGSSAAPTAFVPGPSDVGLGSVTNDAQTKASVMPNTAPSAGQIPIGTGSAYTPATLTAGVGVLITNASGSITLTSVPSGGGGNIPQPPALAGFTWVNQGSSTATQNGGAGTPILVAIPRTAALNWRLLTMAQPSTPYHLSVVYKAGQNNANSSTSGIYFRDSVGGKMLGLELLTQAGVATIRVQRITNTTTDGSTVFTNAIYNAPASFNFSPINTAIWRIRNDGSKLYFDWSFDGYNWSNWYNENVGTWLTPDSVGIGGVAATGGTTDFTIISFSGWDLSAGATL